MRRSTVRSVSATHILRRRPLVLLWLAGLIAAVSITANNPASLSAQASQAPGGFIEAMNSTAGRAQPTASQISGFVPASRGRFFFPAPYNTEAYRLTVPSDCGGGDCVGQDGYSFWRNINAHQGQPIVRFFVALNGSGGPTLITLDKSTGVVTRVGPIFTSGPLTGSDATGWQWSATNPDILYAYGTSQLIAKNVATGAESVVLDLASAGARAVHGAGTNVRVWSAMTSNDGLSWVMTVRASGGDIGCAIHHVPSGEWHFISGLGDCFVDKSGTYWLKTSTNSDIRKGTVYPWSIGEALSDQQGAPGHLDVGWGFFIGEDNWAPLGQTLRIWDLTQPFSAGGGQGRTVHTMTSWIPDSYVQPTWAMGRPATLSTVGPQVGCSTSTAGQPVGTIPREREIVCFQMDGSMRALVVAPNMTNMSASGGGIPYYKAPKGNMDVTGEYYFWITNMGGNRLEAFAVRLPLHLLTGGGSGDTTLPTVSLTAPTGGSTVTGSVTVSATASDNVGVAGVQFRLDGNNLGSEDTTSPYSVSWNSTSVPNGAHTLTAVARDAAGNVRTSSAVSVTVSNVAAGDTTPPTVTMSEPASGATVSGSVTVSATATDNVGVVGVQFLLDGANLGTEDTSSPYSMSWNTIGVSNGAHTLTARARDAAGNTTTATSRTVTVSNTTQATGPVAAYGYSENSGSTAADAAAASYPATLQGASWGAGRYGSALAPNGSGFAEAADRDALSPGASATFSAWVYLTSAPTELASIVNKWSQSAEDEFLFGVLPNRTPYFAWQTTGGATWGGTSFNETTDPTPVPLNTWTHLAVVRSGATLRFYVNGTVTSSVSVMDNNPFRNGGNSLRVGGQSRGGASRLLPGRIDDVRIYGRALADSEIAADMNASVGPAPDTTPPNVSVTAPASGATVAGTLAITATATDNVGVAGVQFLVNGTAVGAEDTTAPYSFSWLSTLVANGTHIVAARARDAAGNVQTSAGVTINVLNVVPDTTLPNVSVTAPANGATVSSTVSITATASDNIGVVGVQFYVDGTALGAEDTTSPYSASWLTTGVSNGAHSITARARDAAGNTRTSTAISVTVQNQPADTTPPTVSLTSPSDGSTVTGTITVSATAADNVGVAYVVFKVDGVAIGPDDTTSPYSISWNTSAIGGGTHTIVAVATDAAGNSTASAARTVTVNNSTTLAPPVAAYAYNESGGTTAADSSASGNSGTLVGATWAAGRYGSSLAANGAGLADAPDLDALSFGTAATMSAWIYLTSAPTELASIVNKWGQSADDEYMFGVTTGRQLYFAWQTEAGTGWGTPGFNEATATGPQIPLNTWTHVAVIRNGTSLSFYVDGALVSSSDAMDAQAFRNGVNSLRIGGQQRGGQNRFFPGRIDEVRLYSRILTTADLASDMTTPIVPPADSSAPTVALTGPAAGSTVSGTVSITATASDNVGVSGVQFRVNGANQGSEDGSAPYSISWNTTTVANGTYTLTAVARDAAGNVATSAAVTVTVQNQVVDTTPPVASVASPADGSTVSGTVTIMAAASDNVGVAGVRFRLDGTNLGAEDTTAPYSVNWNTTTATNGPHAVTVIARDAAGNTTTSAPVTIVVSNTSPLSGLIASFSFNEGTGTTAGDSSTSANPATLGGAASWGTGRSGSALALNGAGYANAADIPGLTPGTAATFEAWVLLTETPTELSSIFNKWSQSTNDEYLLGLDASRRPFFSWRTKTATNSYGTPSYNEAIAPAQVPLNAWTHIAVVRNGTVLTFYVNGAVVSQSAAMDNSAFRDGNNSLRIGGQGRAGAARYFPGRIDEARIYNRALTQAEIQARVSAGGSF